TDFKLSSPSRYFSDTSLLNSNENLLIRSSVTDLVSNYWGALHEKVGTYVTNAGLMATYGGQFTLTYHWR
ncbi:hypothetical protein, partial [Escherichia coli]|uniref:hypothetical protein n=1 Tax=Escherichia coli TaxID=562 RepID=UPI001BC99315